MVKRIIGKVHDNLKITDDFFLLKIKLDTFFACKPGQFVNIKVSKTLTPFLRRPFSIFYYDNNILQILYKVVGEGTKLLSKLRIDEELDILGPSGTGFNLTDSNSLLIAGGVGIGGLYYLTKYLHNYNILLGVNTEAEKDKLMTFLNNERLITVSMEKKGSVVDYLMNNNISMNYIYSCGPEIMMKNLYLNYMKPKGIKGEFSLESHMACGIGVCMGCVKKIRKNDNIQNLRVCKEGPVFNASDIIWE